MTLIQGQLENAQVQNITNADLPNLLVSSGILYYNTDTREYYTGDGGSLSKIGKTRRGVGSAADVTNKRAAYTSLQTAINDSSDGDEIEIMSATITENIILNKKLKIVGQGEASVIDGTFDCQAGSNHSDFEDFKWNDNVTIDSGVTGLRSYTFLATGKTITDNNAGTCNLIFSRVV